MYNVYYRIAPSSDWQKAACEPLHDPQTAEQVAVAIADALKRGGNHFAQAQAREVQKQYAQPVGDKNGDPIYSDEQLRYAATARCKCGAGLAYVKDADHRMPAQGVGGAWFCSDLLTGRADPDWEKHDKGYPFVEYEVKSEEQSRDGHTTRPQAQA